MTEFSLQQKRAAYIQALEMALVKIIAQLSQMPEVERAILFGSYAAGRRDLFTDLDLLIVMDTEKDLLQRTSELYEKVQTGVDVDFLVYTPEEISRSQENSLIHHAYTTGQVIYEKKRA